jgi:hypothetical protein
LLRAIDRIARAKARPRRSLPGLVRPQGFIAQPLHHLSHQIFLIIVTSSIMDYARAR